MDTFFTWANTILWVLLKACLLSQSTNITETATEMEIKALHVAAGLLLVVSTATAVELNAVTRKFSGEDFLGEYELFVQQGLCPNKIRHKNLTAVPLTHDGTIYTAYSISHAEIEQNGQKCTSMGRFSIVPNAVIDAAGYRDALGTQAPVVNELNMQNAKFHVGVEISERICGDSRISINSLAIFVEQEFQVSIPGLITLHPGAKYMVIYEKESPTPCTYFQKDEDRVIGEALVSSTEAGISQPDRNSPVMTVAPISDSIEEGTEPAPSDEPDDSPTCFPHDSTITLEDGTVKSMGDLQLGDRVQVAPGEFSDVFMFSHRDAEVKASFVQLMTESGAYLHITAGHYMYVNDQLTAAGAVRTGDTVYTENGKVSKVCNVSSTLKAGIYNPQTVHGDIVVNGILTSTYTTSVHPRAAHSLLAPLRSLFRLLHTSTSVFNHGARFLAEAAPKGDRTI